jgi:hypothetical protein
MMCNRKLVTGVGRSDSSEEMMTMMAKEERDENHRLKLGILLSIVM